MTPSTVTELLAKVRVSLLGSGPGLNIDLSALNTCRAGANVSFLYKPSEYMALGTFRGVSLHGGANGGLNYTALPPQNAMICGVELSKVPFVSLTGAEGLAHIRF